MARHGVLGNRTARSWGSVLLLCIAMGFTGCAETANRPDGTAPRTAYFKADEPEPLSFQIYNVTDILNKIRDFPGPQIRVTSRDAPDKPETKTPLDRERELALRDADEVWIVIDGDSPDATGTPADDLRSGGLWVGDSVEDAVPIPLFHTSVDATIHGFLSTVRVRQEYQNNFEEPIEAHYVFPLPHDSAVRDFEVVVGDRRIRGVIRERKEAEQIYAEARARGQTASLLTQERPNVFVQKISKLAPGEPIDVTLTYDAPLRFADDELEWVFPMVVGPRYRSTFEQRFLSNERCGHDIAITVHIPAASEWAALDCATHEIEIEEHADGSCTVRLAEGAVIPNRDFILRTLGAGPIFPSQLVWAKDGDESFFHALIVPPPLQKLIHAPPKEFVFVIDCSASMSGAPLKLSRRAVMHALRKYVGPRDTFQIMKFSNDASALSREPLRGVPHNFDFARRQLEELTAEGGTEMIRGIRAALRPAPNPNRPRVVTFFTDGYVGQEAEVFEELARSVGETRIFSFGVGTSVNRHCLEGIARFGRGAAAYVTEGVDAVWTIDAFFERLKAPMVESVEIDWRGLLPSELATDAVPDLIAGRPLLLSGRFEGELPSSISLRGKACDTPIEIEVPLHWIEGEPQAVRTLWARSQLSRWQDELTVEPDPEWFEKMTSFALEEGLVSAGTAFIALDENDRGGASAVTRAVVPAAVPASAAAQE